MDIIDMLINTTVKSDIPEFEIPIVMSDNYLWKKVLTSDNFSNLNMNVEMITECGIIICKDCKSEKVHYCLEDQPLVPKGPASFQYLRNISKIKNKITTIKYLSFKNFRRGNFKNSAIKIHSMKKIKNIKIQKLSNKMSQKNTEIKENIYSYK